MRQMLAAVLRGPNDLVVEPIPMLPPDEGELMCRVRACGICGSDLRYLAGENPWAMHTLGYEKPNPPNMVLGHEVAGMVDAGTGETAAALLAFRTCGECKECERGESQLCRHTAHLGHGAGWDDREYNPGGMAEFMPIWKENVYELPSSISFAEATFLDGLGVAIHAVRRSGIRPGDRLALLGAGPVGMLLAQAAAVDGAAAFAAVDLYDAALECARELGASLVLDGRGGSAAEIMSEIRHWSGDRGCDAVFDTTGLIDVQKAALSLLAPGGTLMLMAGAAEGLELHPGLMAGERTVTTSSNNLPEDFARGVELLASGEIRVAPMITHEFDLADAPRAFEVAAEKHETGAIKVILRP